MTKCEVVFDGNTIEFNNYLVYFCEISNEWVIVGENDIDVEKCEKRKTLEEAIKYCEEQK